MRSFILAVFILLPGVLGIDAAWAQQTIFNVPSADVTPKGHVFVQTESQTRFFGTQQYYNGTEYAAVGIGLNTELDATLCNFSAPASNNRAILLGFKSTVPLLKQSFESREFKLTVGSHIPISIDGQGVGNWSYAHLSGRIPKLNTRLTLGTNYGTRQMFGRNQVSVIAGYEQPVTKKFSLIGDWYSGTHGSAYFIPGFSYAFPKNITLYAGYQIPNSRQVGRSGFVFELAKIF